MKSNARWMLAFAVMFWTCLNCRAATRKEVDEATVMMSGATAEQRAAAATRAKDPAWKPSYNEVALIQVGSVKKPGELKNFCLNAEGNILACFGAGIRVYSPKGDLLKTLPLSINPGTICVAKDASIFVAGDGKVLKLDAAGKVLASAESPVAKLPVVIGKDLEQMAKESGRPLKEEMARMKTSLEKRRADVTGLAVTDQDLFMAVPAPNEFTYRVYRFDHALKDSKLVVEKLRGCCGQMDIQAHDSKLWIPHNARHSVETRDRDGNELSKFGKAGKVKASDFGGCCEPKNMRVLANGEILVAESGPPTCIKLFSASGEFIKVLAVAQGKGDCVRVTVERSPDGSRYYMLDTQRAAIRVFGSKS